MQPHRIGVANFACGEVPAALQKLRIRSMIGETHVPVLCRSGARSAKKQVVITGKDVNHIKNVLRMKVGEEIAVSNGVDGREYRCGILQMTEDAVICELRFIKEDGVELPLQKFIFSGTSQGG